MILRSTHESYTGKEVMLAWSPGVFFVHATPSTLDG